MANNNNQKTEESQEIIVADAVISEDEDPVKMESEQEPRKLFLVLALDGGFVRSDEVEDYNAQIELEREAKLEKESKK